MKAIYIAEEECCNSPISIVFGFAGLSLGVLNLAIVVPQVISSPITLLDLIDATEGGFDFDFDFSCEFR